MSTIKITWADTRAAQRRRLARALRPNLYTIPIYVYEYIHILSVSFQPLFLFLPLPTLFRLSVYFPHTLQTYASIILFWLKKQSSFAAFILYERAKTNLLYTYIVYIVYYILIYNNFVDDVPLVESRINSSGCTHTEARRSATDRAPTSTPLS